MLPLTCALERSCGDAIPQLADAAGHLRTGCCHRNGCDGQLLYAALSVGLSSVGLGSVGSSSVGPRSVGSSSVGTRSVGLSSVGLGSVGPSSVGPSHVGTRSVAWKIVTGSSARCNALIKNTLICQRVMVCRQRPTCLRTHAQSPYKYARDAPINTRRMLLEDVHDAPIKTRAMLVQACAYCR